MYLLIVQVMHSCSKEVSRTETSSIEATTTTSTVDVQVGLHDESLSGAISNSVHRGFFV